MILETLTLSNFGLFCGTQCLDLKPQEQQGRTAPIILIGGMNGSGKTTILDAIQLALYGGRAQCSKRSGQSYDSFLRQSIHQGIDANVSASIGLSFEYAEEGVTLRYVVRRSWEAIGDNVREALVVTKDGKHDTWLSDNWNQIVDDLIPFGLSQLFFFDGEKIRALAEESTAKEVLEASIKSLLGLDIIERLLADITIVQTKLLKRSGNATESQGLLTQLEDNFRKARAELVDVKSERASLENQRLRAENDLAAAENNFRTMGGQYWANRETTSRDLAALESRQYHISQQLLSLTAGDLPLAMLKPLLSLINQRNTTESLSRMQAALSKASITRDRLIVKALKANGESTAAAFIEGWLRQDRQTQPRDSTRNSDVGVNMSAAAADRLRRLLDEGLSECIRESKELSVELAAVRRDIESRIRSQTAIPEDRMIAPIADRFKLAAAELAGLTEKAQRLESDITAKGAVVSRCEQILRNKLDEHVKEQFQNEDAFQLAGVAGRSREILKQFLVKATNQKIDRLSATITESFRFLLRKQSLIYAIDIDAETFDIELRDKDGRVVPKNRLSEGEKQIFAVSVLWGLGKCSPRRLPAVIDTPMARLDTTHRGHLVDRYFPNASHQVIILSTDTEVDEQHFRSLEPYISRGYFLKYDEFSRSTTAEEGYFWTARNELMEMSS